MRVVSWNVNGVRTSKVQIKDLLERFSCDILCLQETKLTRDQLDEETAILDGYNSYYSFSRTKTGYSGVATICKDNFTPFAAEEGLTGVLSVKASNNKNVVGFYGDTCNFNREELNLLDSEGRALITKHQIKLACGAIEFITFINVYCPHAISDNVDRQNFKLHFCQLLQKRAEAILASGSHVVIAGDLNISRKPIDTSKPIDLKCFESNEARMWLNNFLIELSITENQPLEELGNINFVDTFRYFHPHRANAFTCWSTATGARQTNYGTRLDYILTNAQLVVKAFISSDIHPQFEGSDHCPITAEISCHTIKATTCPSLCTKNWPEFAGKQQKLHSFFSKFQKSPETNCHLKSPTRKHKLTSDNPPSKKLKSNKQQNLSSFFMTRTLAPSSSEPNQLNSETGENVNKGKEISETKLSSPKVQPAAYKWKNVLTGPMPPPHCNGHGEPCVLRTVKKSGTNYGREFYTCARPEGQKDNPEARCNYFKWKR